MINTKEFYKTFLFVLLTFISSRIISQTNILMLSPLGEEYVAAYIIPNKFMIIDTIIIFALAPVVSIAVSGENDLNSKKKIIKSFISFTLVLSVLLMIIGFIFYPILVNLFVNYKIQALANIGIFWMNLSIPIRMLIFIFTMVLYSSPNNNKIWYVYLITILLNVFLSWYFIYYQKLGFIGSYYSTFIIFFIEFLWLLYLVIDYIKSWPFTFFNIQIIYDLIKSILSEGFRLLSWQLEGFFIVALLSSREVWIPILSIYSIISPFLDLILMPFIALMRSSSIEIAKFEKNNIYTAFNLIKNIKNQVLVFSVCFGIIMIFLSKILFENIYSLSGVRLVWWNTFIIIICLSLPIMAYGYLLRSCFQACSNFFEISKFEILTSWFIYIPLIIFSIFNNNPFIFFISFVLTEIIIIFLLNRRLKFDRKIIQFD